MSPLAQASVPKESATVILVRENHAGSWDVFLAHRHQSQSFMAGAYVFPGGQVDTSDTDPGLSNYIANVENFNPRVLLNEPALSPELAQGLFICAIRETFEETGVLFAQTGGDFLQLNSGPDGGRFSHYRRELNLRNICLQDILSKENLFLALDELIPYAHWITPEIMPKRYSTRFFLARLPDGQSAITDSDELTDFLWVIPTEALRKHLKKEISLMPPTLKTLDELAAFPDLDALFAHTRRRAIYPILPQPGDNFLKLPHDPEYSIAGYKQPPRPLEASRLIVADGIWQTAFYSSK